MRVDNWRVPHQPPAPRPFFWIEHPPDWPRERKVPIIPPLPPRDSSPNPTVAICGECGLHIKRIMHYACLKANCPVFERCRMGV